MTKKHYNLKNLETIWQEGEIQQISKGEIDKSWKDFKQKISLDESTSQKNTKLLKGYKIAATACIFLLGTFFINFFINKPKILTVYNSNIKPLTITLPDSSKVILAYKSKLEYPEKFYKKSREVTLKGKGFFEVVKHKNYPFIVTAENTKTKVLGTSFNIIADSINNKATISLFTGKIEVSVLKDTWKMSPGDEFEWNMKNRQPRLVHFNKEIVGSWRNNKYQMTNEPLLYVLKVLETRYNVLFKIDNNNNKLNNKVTLTIDYNSSLEEILETLSIINSLRFTINKKEHNEKVITIQHKK